MQSNVNMFNSGRTFCSYSQLSWTRTSSELVVPELSHSDIAYYWHIVNYHSTWYLQACIMASQLVISSTFKNMSQAKAREPGVTPYSSSNSGFHGMHCSGQQIISLAWVILRGGLVFTSVLNTLCIVFRLACTSVLSTVCIVLISSCTSVLSALCIVCD